MDCVLKLIKSTISNCIVYDSDVSDTIENIFQMIEDTELYPLLTKNAFSNIFNKVTYLNENNEVKINNLIDYIQFNPEHTKYGLYCDTVFPLHTSIEFTEEQINVWKQKVSELKELPQHAQRSNEWYKQREQCISASDIASAIGESKYGKKNDIVLQKCGHPSSFKGNIYTEHGQKYEDIALALYEKIYNVKVFEFGLIPHGFIKSHSKKTVSFIGASPDGITEEGVMVEIKCPMRRKINNYNQKTDKCTTGDKTVIPHEYFIQMQTQLEACDLEICDFVECDIVEYKDKAEFLADSQPPRIVPKPTSKAGKIAAQNAAHNAELCAASKTADYKIKGLLIYNKDTSKYIYPDKLYDYYSEWKEWETSIREKYYNNTLEVKYFKMNHFEIFRVYRDQEYFAEKLIKITAFWNRVLHCRENQNELEPYLESRQKRDASEKAYEQRTKIMKLCQTKCFI